MLKRLLTTLLLAGLALPASVLAAGEAASTEAFFAATLDDAQGRPMALTGLHGRPLLVNFWATWCVPCRAEIPPLVDAYEQRKSAGLTVVGIALDDEAAKVADFTAAQDVSYPVLMGRDQAMALMKALGNDRKAVPFTVAIDAEGRIVGTKVGILLRADLQRLLAALASPPAPIALHR